MKKTQTYTQCFFRRGTAARIAWIPTEFAVVGKKIDLKLNGKWDRGWKVETTWETELSRYVEAHETDYKRQRKASDI